MPEQLTLSMPLTADTGLEDFIETDSNRNALHLIDMWPEWHPPWAVVIGPQQSGKTHLTSLAKTISQGAIAVWDDADQALWSHDLEVALFHHLNWLRENQHLRADAFEDLPLHATHPHACQRLLLTAQTSIDQWGLTLPDLISRLKGAQAATIHQPDDAMLPLLLAKHFADRQILVHPSVISYLVPRLVRRYTAIVAIVEALDAAALTKQQSITLPLARQVLETLTLQDEE